MIYTLIISLVAILFIGFMRGSFLALIITVLYALIWYHFGIYFALGLVVFFAINFKIYRLM
mgnify:CR=1 FL=1